jgi:hypothetical protein
MNVIGLKKCPKCGFKELYGCHNYYTVGDPFFCPKCKTPMDYTPYQFCNCYLSDKEYQKTWDLLQKHLDTLDYITTEISPGVIRQEWVGLPD